MDMPGTDKAGVLAMKGAKSGDQWGKRRHLEVFMYGSAGDLYDQKFR